MSSRWWATVWSSAIESSVFADTSQLDAGRRLARRADDLTIAVEPGSASLRSDRWVAQIGVTGIDDDHWERLCRLIGSDTMLSAAVLDGELPTELFAASIGAGIRLAPGPGDILGECSCLDWHEPCAHVVALCELLSGHIDADPWTFALLRGRARHEIVERVQAERGRSGDGSPGGPRGDDPGVAAGAAFRRSPAPLPPARTIPRTAGTPVAITVEPPIDAGIEHRDLVRLAADAADRAVRLLNGERLDLAGDVSAHDNTVDAVGSAHDPSALGLSEREDLARLAAAADPALLAERVGESVETLAMLARAWNVGGPSGVRIVDTPASPTHDDLAVAAAVLGPEVRIRNNAVICGQRSYRVDADGCWWIFEPDPDLGWLLVERLGALA